LKVVRAYGFSRRPTIYIVARPTFSGRRRDSATITGELLVVAW